jgi:hypothetical protein
MCLLVSVAADLVRAATVRTLAPGSLRATERHQRYAGMRVPDRDVVWRCGKPDFILTALRRPARTRPTSAGARETVDGQVITDRGTPAHPPGNPALSPATPPHRPGLRTGRRPGTRLSCQQQGDSLDDLFPGSVPHSTEGDDARYTTALAFFYGRHRCSPDVSTLVLSAVACSLSFRESRKARFPASSMTRHRKRAA